MNPNLRFLNRIEAYINVGKTHLHIKKKNPDTRGISTIIKSVAYWEERKLWLQQQKVKLKWVQIVKMENQNAHNKKN